MSLIIMSPRPSSPPAAASSRGGRAGLLFQRKEDTQEETVRAAPNLSRSSHRGGKGGASVPAIPLSPLDEALFVRPLIISWAFVFRGQHDVSGLQHPLCMIHCSV